ncbi:MAG: outer membrane protein assembly factor BamA [Victivallales bacterium]|nr:outer membrane protein assembly factor BamA [Victivallales bacterium]
MVKRTLIFAVCAVVFCVSAWAESIGKIVVKATSPDMNQETLEQIVFSTIGSKAGDTFSAATVSEDIRKLMQNELFDNVKISTDRTDDARVILTFTVTPRPVVKSIRIQGAKIYKAKKLRKHIKHAETALLDDVQLATDRKAILNKYREAGFYGTEVSTVKSPNPNGGIDVTFVVTEEERHKLKKVYFRNNTVFTESELRDAIVTRRQWWRYIIRFGNYYNSEQAALDKDRLLRLYGQKGYMDFAVSDIIVKKTDGDKWVEVTYVLEEGSPYTIGSIELSGAQRFKAEDLLARTVSKVGDFHDSEREEADINRMKAKYEVLGYIDLRLWATHKKDTVSKKVDVLYSVVEGRPATIRNIDINGNTITRDEVVRRELVIAPRDKADNGKIRLSKQRIQNLGFFETVDILPVSTDEPDVKDLRIDLKERPTGQVSVGAGFSSEDNAIAFIEFNETNFDLMRFLGAEWPPKGDGQKLGARFQFGKDVSNVTISHTEPWFLDRRLRLTTDFFLRNRYEREYDQRNIGMGMMLSWPLEFSIPGTDFVDDKWSIGLGFRVESVRISDVDEHDPESAMTKGDFVKGHVLADEEDTYTANRLILKLTRDSRNAFLFPTRGTLFSVTGEMVTEALGSYETYGRLEIDATKYIPVFRDYVLKLDASYYTNTGDDAAIFDRYFAGGPGTVRGFRRREVAPVDCYEDPYGGHSMLTGTVELIKPVQGFMFVSTFLDAGNAWWDDFDADLGDLNYSVGVAVQFKAFPINISYGVPISTTWDHLDGKHGRLHFNIGISY